MRKILLFVVAFSIFSLASAQDTTWHKGDAAIYGTPLEKRQQLGLANKAGHELYRLVGFKEFYVNGIAIYMQMNGYNLDNSQDVKGGGGLYTFSPRVGIGKIQKIYLRYWLNADKRITKAKLTGAPAGLANLFISYWPTDLQWSNTAQLKQGIVATKMLLDEKITFNYQAQVPFIEVSK